MKTYALIDAEAVILTYMPFSKNYGVPIKVRENKKMKQKYKILFKICF